MRKVLDEAADAFRPCRAMNVALLQQVDALERQGRSQRALAVLDSALQQQPEHPQWLYRRAMLLLAMHRHRQAVQTLQLLINLVPGQAPLHNALGGALVGASEFQAATVAFGEACRLAPQRGDYAYNLGRACASQGDVIAACTAFDRALQHMPGDVESRIARADCLRALGRLTEAAADFRDVLRIKPDSLAGWTGLVQLKTAQLSDAELQQLDALHRASEPDSDARLGLGFALGQALESAKHYSRAYATILESNAIKARKVHWQAAALGEFVDASIVAYSGSMAKAPDAQLGSGAIFLVGMPRSGSTLIEQVLSAHPRVEGAGELLDAHAVLEEENQRRGKAITAWVGEATAEDWQRLGSEYWRRTARWRQCVSVFTDKQLDNWRYVGALHAMLPGARFIHCRRDPLETCWSCYKHNFQREHASFSYTPEHLAHYWANSERLLRFWQGRYPGLVHQQDLAALIDQPEANIQRLLEHCGLAMDPACLNFNKSTRVVFTASAGQVRQPLQRQTDKSRHYGALLDPLRRALDSAAHGTPNATGDDVAGG
ncbi:MAG TPA: sulfotransferase [Rhodanobacteraceae bacterium]|nr:sulfotransferase [Rhodanobacteraceae bacterium]